jgi:hypothetical protein
MRGLAQVRGGGQQAEGTGARDGLRSAVRAELGVQVAQVGPDGVTRDVQLAGDLRPGQVGRQVAQHPDLAVAQRLRRRPRPGGRRGSPAGQQAQDLSDQRGVRGALPGLALEPFLALRLVSDAFIRDHWDAGRAWRVAAEFGYGESKGGFRNPFRRR